MKRKPRWLLVLKEAAKALASLLLALALVLRELHPYVAPWLA